MAASFASAVISEPEKPILTARVSKVQCEVVVQGALFTISQGDQFCEVIFGKSVFLLA